MKRKSKNVTESTKKAKVSADKPAAKEKLLVTSGASVPAFAPQKNVQDKSVNPLETQLLELELDQAPSGSPTSAPMHKLRTLLQESLGNSTTALADPLIVKAVRDGNVVAAVCQACSKHFSGELEYAFYLMVGGKRALVQWYTASPEVCFTVPDDVGSHALGVWGFVREKAHPERKLMRVVSV